MKFFNIFDIRLFWSEDFRFVVQFEEYIILEFKLFSKYLSIYKDVVFWIIKDFFLNNLFDVIRGIVGDIVEKVY